MGEAVTVGRLYKFQLCRLLLPEPKCSLNKLQRRAGVEDTLYSPSSASDRLLAVDEIQLREYKLIS